MRKTLATLLLTASVALAGCSAPTSTSTATSGPAPATSTAATTPTPAAPVDATGWANKVSLTSTQKVVTITEDNDPNSLLGRPNGYVSAAVIYDSGAECSELGVSCGGTVEVWPSAADAQQRSEYIQGNLKEVPAFGTEYHTLNGAALLRISGRVKPSVANEYAAQFVG